MRIKPDFKPINIGNRHRIVKSPTAVKEGEPVLEDIAAEAKYRKSKDKTAEL